MTASPFDHPVLGAWLGDPPTLAALVWEAEARALLDIWIALAAAQAELGLIPAASADAIARALTDPPPAEALGDRARADGVVVPGLVAALRERLPADARAHLHNGATSQDIVDTGLMLRLRGLLRDHADRLRGVEAALDGLDARFGDRPLMAVTRMRDALPIRVSDRLATWRAGVTGARGAACEATLRLPVQLAGPVGTLDRRADPWADVRPRLAARLGLTDPGRSWHTDRTPLVVASAPFEATARAMGKIGLDAGLMAMDPVGALRVSGGASSSMPHKVNPVDAELAVAAARHAALLHGGLAGAALHELERSGAGWTLEWLILPQLAASAGAGLAAVERLLGAVEGIGTDDLGPG